MNLFQEIFLSVASTSKNTDGTRRFLMRNTENTNDNTASGKKMQSVRNGSKKFKNNTQASKSFNNQSSRAPKNVDIPKKQAKAGSAKVVSRDETLSKRAFSSKNVRSDKLRLNKSSGRITIKRDTVRSKSENKCERDVRNKIRIDINGVESGRIDEGIVIDEFDVEKKTEKKISEECRNTKKVDGLQKRNKSDLNEKLRAETRAIGRAQTERYNAMSKKIDHIKPAIGSKFNSNTYKPERPMFDKSVIQRSPTLRLRAMSSSETKKKLSQVNTSKSLTAYNRPSALKQTTEVAVTKDPRNEERSSIEKSDDESSMLERSEFPEAKATNPEHSTKSILIVEDDDRTIELKKQIDRLRNEYESERLKNEKLEEQNKLLVFNLDSCRMEIRRNNEEIAKLKEKYEKKNLEIESLWSHRRRCLEEEYKSSDSTNI